MSDAGDDNDDQQQQDHPEYEIREQDRLLPMNNISRLLKCALPDNAKVSQEAKETMQECASEFVQFLTSEAMDRCIADKRKTINGEDLLWALQSLGFDNFLEPLKVYLTMYREAHKESHKSTGGGNNNRATIAPSSNDPMMFNPNMYSTFAQAQPNE
jgi:nuclear transcription Y subunit beta